MRAALLAIVAAGLLVAPAAQAAGSPATRAEAKRLALMELRFQRSTTKVLTPLEAEFDRTLTACAVGPDDAPASVEDQTATRAASLYLRAAAVRTGASMDRFIVRLQAFRTRDFRLRRTARSMAASYRLFGVLAEAPPEPCAYFEQWKAAGWDPAFRIQPPVRNFTTTEVRSLERHGRIVRSGARHMRKLGVSARRTSQIVEGWTDDGIFALLAL